MKWQDPPESAGRPWGNRIKYTEEAAQLRSEPGRWALFQDCPDTGRAHRLVDQINRGGLASFSPRGTFEARSAGTKIWVRYVGTEAQK